MRFVLWTGPAWETWGADSVLTGIGGSESAAVYLSWELAKLGHEVEVVGQVRPSETTSGSGTVRFTPMQEFAEYHNTPGPHAGMLRRSGRKMECDVFVSSRYITALQNVRPDCRLKVLWMHDVHAGPDHYGLLREYDEVFCLSKWSLEMVRRFYPHVTPEKFVQTRNGVPVLLYLPLPVKEGFKVVYSSSPDRGLDRLLDLWPAVRQLRPDAELHVYYGFDTWEAMAVHACDDVAIAQIQVFRTRLANMAGQGVTLYGRVGQPELARAWLGASAWLYPTAFSETSCITAMEAQAAGAACVCTRLAALAETARFATFVDPPSSRSGYREDFTRAVAAVASGREHPLVPTLTEDRAAEGRSWALRNLGWDGVARQWSEHFEGRLRP